MDHPGSIATHYHLDPAQTAAMNVGGLRAFAALDRRDLARRLIALQALGDLPPRARVLARAAQGAPIAHLAMPLDHGPGRGPGGKPGFFILCPAMPGAALTAERRPWSEAEVLRCLLRPAASALEALAERGMTHRAIRPDNIFRAGPGEPITLGPFWATPPGSLQPDAFEPPYSAMCLPAGRGDGTIADDVYSLAVTIIWCLLDAPAAAGQAPPATNALPPRWADAPALLHRKLSFGSLAALAAGANISAAMQDLLHGMLADDRDHRPTPARLLSPEQSRNRRLAARPPCRASRPLQVGVIEAWTARELALALATDPDGGLALLNNGAVDRWVRRLLGDGPLAVRLDEAMQRDDSAADADASRRYAIMMMCCICVLDPLAPMVWRGVALLPDGLGSALAAAQSANKPLVCAALEEIVAHDLALAWAAQQTRRRDIAGLRQDTQEWRAWLVQRGPMGGLKRLIYGLNPMLACGSPLLAGQVAARLQDLLPALEAAALGADRTRPPIDVDMAAFIAARADGTLLADIGPIEGFATADDRLAVVALFGRLQARLHPAPLPGLAGWLLASGLVDLSVWRNVALRKSQAARLADAASAGQIDVMQLLVQDDAARSADREAAERAAARVAAIGAELTALHAAAPARAAAADRLGHEIAAGTGLLAVVGAAVALAMSI